MHESTLLWAKGMFSAVGKVWPFSKNATEPTGYLHQEKNKKKQTKKKRVLTHFSYLKQKVILTEL